ncbi:Alpha/Beta hydrolase protein [Aspergillus alliaceus]|uniref:Alpha/Beta hydrolase protein n=1 Tax=Petromyces alliaceus TaxID=209559 RepID=A0A5N7BWC9_PETAA|nr:Alpha/Beta hydrolase protein [Aspergillus alliaceus]
MPRFSSPFDGAQLFYRDYKPSPSSSAFRANMEYDAKKLPALVFLHGWPYSSQMYEELMVPLCETYRFRCIAPDRRGFGKSDWDGHQATDFQITYEVFADDTAYLLQTLDIGSFVIIASSMGPGESVLAHSRSEYFQQNCKGFVWLSPALPYPLQTPNNPLAPSQAVWDSILDGFRSSRADFTQSALPGALVGGTGLEIPAPTLQRYVNMVGEADGLALERCMVIVPHTDLTSLLVKLGETAAPPIMCIHGDSDAGTPYEATAKLLKEILPEMGLKLYEKGAHALQITHKSQLQDDILEFVTQRIIAN